MFVTSRLEAAACKSVPMEMFWSRENKKFLQDHSELLPDVWPAGVAGGLRVWGEDINLEHREGRGAVRLQIQGIEDVVGAAWQTRSPKLQWGMRLLGESSEGGM